MHLSAEMSRMMIRLPRDVKAWLSRQAIRNASSQGSEIVRAVREKMDREVGVASSSKHEKAESAPQIEHS